MPWGAAIGGALALGGSLLSSNAASSAASDQSAAAQQALQFQQQVYGDTKANLSPFVATGTSALGSLAQLYGLPVPGGGTAASAPAPQATPAPSMTGFGQSAPAGWTAANGLPAGWSWAPASNPYGQNQLIDAYGNPVGNFPAATTLPQALTQFQSGGSPAPATTGGAAPSSGAPGAQPNGALAAFNQFTQLPSYQFPLSQGIQAVDRSAAANGTLNSGGTLKALTQYGQGYASTGFGNYVNQLSQLAQLGQNSAVMQGNQANTSASGVASILGNLGTAQASGAVGSANAINGGLSNLLPFLTNATSSFGGGGAPADLSGVFGGVGP